MDTQKITFPSDGVLWPGDGLSGEYSGPSNPSAGKTFSESPGNISSWRTVFVVVANQKMADIE
jgi:hypothetical protein